VGEESNRDHGTQHSETQGWLKRWKRKKGSEYEGGGAGRRKGTDWEGKENTRLGAMAAGAEGGGVAGPS
jgi:hypothetical protein